MIRYLGMTTIALSLMSASAAAANSNDMKRTLVAQSAATVSEGSVEAARASLDTYRDQLAAKVASDDISAAAAMDFYAEKQRAVLAEIKQSMTQDYAKYVQTASMTASCLNGFSKIQKKVCRHTLIGPEGMYADPASIVVEGNGYKARSTKVSMNEIDFVIETRMRGKKTVTITADFKYAPEKISDLVLADLDAFQQALN